MQLDLLLDQDSFVDILLLHLEQSPDLNVITYLPDDGSSPQVLTYAQLVTRSKAVAVELSKSAQPGDRALLMFNSGLEFVEAFIGCVMAGVIAVPAYPPKRNRNLDRVESIILDSDAKVLLTSSTIYRVAGEMFESHDLLKHRPCIRVDEVDSEQADQWCNPRLSEKDLMFLQYTSGSTGDPKGVMVSHRNAISNLAMICRGCGYSESTVSSSWLPLFHDMGLIGGLLAPIYRGFPVVIMSPASFLKNPRRWLQAITEYKITETGGPNFAYDLCVNEIPRAKREGLDLSSLRQISSGAEPVNFHTIKRFVSAFKELGLREDVFTPTYGMAECTLYASGEVRSQFLNIEPEAFEQHKVVPTLNPWNAKVITGNGVPNGDCEIIIADPESKRTLAEGEVGEIWMRGSHVAEGYWNKPEVTEETFHAYTSDTGDGPYLRTGDLGALYSGHLYITGRHKDLIIIRGSNYYPQDFEGLIERLSDYSEAPLPEFDPSCAAAFTIENDNEEQLVLVVELNRHYFRDVKRASTSGEWNVMAPNGVASEITKVISEQYELSLHDIVFIKTGTLPKTSSGKVQRRKTKLLYQERNLDLVWEKSSSSDVDVTEESKAPAKATNETSDNETSDLAQWIQAYLVDVAGVDSAVLTEDASFFEIGLNSVALMRLTGELEDQLGRILPNSLLWEHPTISRLVAALNHDASGLVATLPSITKVEDKKNLPLSFSQRRLWFLDQLEGQSAAYNLTEAFKLSGEVNVSALEKSLKDVLVRHEALRTLIQEKDGEPSQKIVNADVFSLTLIDLREARDEGGASEQIEKETNSTFDLSSDLMLRARLVLTGESESYLAITMHHIASDGWSMGVFAQELSNFYKQHLGESVDALSDLPIQYGDYALWQNQLISDNALDGQLKYWKEKLQGVPPLLELPTDRPRPREQSFKGGNVYSALPKPLLDDLRSVAKARGCSLYAVLLSAYQVLLYKYSGQNDFTVGSPVANRTRPETESLIGFFVNNLTLRAQLDDEEACSRLIEQVKTTISEAYYNQDIPFDQIVESINPDRSLSYSPLFQVGFALQSTGLDALDLHGLDVKWQPRQVSTSKFDLNLAFWETAEGATLDFEYSTDLFNRSTVERMLSHYQYVLEQMVADPEQRIGDIRFVSTEDSADLQKRCAAQLVLETNDTLISRFEQQVGQYGNAIALTCDDRSMTYQALDQQANRLAHKLRELGVTRNTLVGLSVDRNEHIVLGILAILKAGGAYVPIDPNYPEERITYVLKDASIDVLLTESHIVDQLPISDVQTVLLDNSEKVFSSYSEAAPESINTPDDLAYIIYTSGSTGNPKGVQITHRNVVRLFDATDAWFKFSDQDVWSLFHSYAFDFSVWEIWGALLFGGRVVVVPKEIARSPEEFHRLLSDEKVTVLNQTPSAFYQLIQADEAHGDRTLSLRYVVFGGEALSLQALKPWMDRHGDSQPQLINMYGITETTVHVTYRPITQADVEANLGSVIGEPIPDLSLYLLDSHQNLLPVGVPGEMCVGGGGVALGYLNREDLTAERFIDNPFVAGEKLYRSGDLARRLENGDLEYLGRIDNQVKIRGFRIELGEIESAIQQHEQVRDAVVLVKSVNDQEAIVAYVVANDPSYQALNVELRKALKHQLPEYMLPTAIVVLDAMPLTANGKVDRFKLPTPELGRDLEQVYVPAEGEVEKQLAIIWSEVIGAEKVGALDNFFDLGGHSLLATQVVSRIQQSFSVDIQVKLIFEFPILRDLAEKIASLTSDGQVGDFTITALSHRDGTDVSFAQQRLWFLDQLEGPSATYNMSTSLNIKGALDVDALKQSFNYILSRHEALRTVFVEKNNVPVQKILVPQEVYIPLTNLVDEYRRNSLDAENEVKKLIEHEASNPFDLSSDLMLRGHLIEMSDDYHILIITMHHIASDGWSLGVFIRELTQSYEQIVNGGSPDLPELAVQYGDFSQWQKQWMEGERCERQLNYWRDQLEGLTPLLQVPTDKPRPREQSFKGTNVVRRIPLSLMKNLHALANKQGVSTFMVAIAGYYILLAKYTGQTDIPVGSPIANRTREEIENMVGFFVNTLTLRAEVNEENNIASLVEQIKGVTLDAYSHQDVPFEYVVDDINPERNLAYSPLFQVVFAFQNVPQETLSLAGLALEERPRFVSTSKFDLNLAFWETAEGATLDFEYSTDLFNRSTVERMLSHYQYVLEQMVADPEQRIGDIRFVSKEDSVDLQKRCAAQLVLETNDTLVSRFEQQVGQYANAVALRCDDRSMTYQVLDQQANRLSHKLRELGVTRNTLVGLSVDRNEHIVLGILAILKAGGAYVPIDPNYPEERIAYVLKDASIDVLLTESHIVDQLPVSDVQTVLLDNSEKVFSSYSEAAPESINTPDDLAYIIYTSGSTGNPKGVQITHRNVVRLFDATDAWFKFSDQDVWSLFHSYAFDFSVWEIWGALLFGGRVVVVPKEIARSPEEFHRLLSDEKVTVLNQTPSAFYQLIQADEAHGDRTLSLRYVVFGGEALSLQALKPWMDRHGDSQPQLINMYGITETTVHVTYRPITQADVEANLGSVIGEPIPDLSLYLLDSHQNLLPVGVPGEMCVGGGGVALGYLNREDLTAKRFIDNPFVSGEKLYRSGDLARRLENGDLEYLGRIDNQVKIRGFRIELGEIESAIQQHEQVRDAVVLVREDKNGDKRIVSYVVYALETESNTDVDQDQVDDWSDVFKGTYDDITEDQDPRFNFVGWNSSYTNERIPDSEMTQWADETVARISQLNPKNVLEIGCGTGLMLFRLAEYFEDYIGADFSRGPIEHIKTKLHRLGDKSDKVTLFHREATQFEGWEDKKFDVVVLNSIAQYFPSVDYLFEVIEKSIRHIKPGGAMFVGDNRNLSLIEQYHESIELFTSHDSVSVNQVQFGAKQRLLQEKELLLMPEFFISLMSAIPEISHVRVMPKQSDYVNELSKHRFDAILYVGGGDAPTVDAVWEDWQEGVDFIASFETRLEQEPESYLGISSVINYRLTEDNCLHTLLADRSPPETAGLLREKIENGKSQAQPLNVFFDLAKKYGRSIEISWLGSESGSYQVVFKPRGCESIRVKFPHENVSSQWRDYANNPYHAQVVRTLVPDLRKRLKASLPEHMVPSAFVLLEKMPLTPNGKVDRKKLPAPEALRISMGGEYVAPRNEHERLLASIWGDVLGLEQVGVKDNFFELGGHSLLATQVMSRVRDVFQVEMSVRELFDAPTIETLTARIIHEERDEERFVLPPIEVSAKTELTPVSYAQQRLWFLEQFEPGNTAYNMMFAQRFIGDVDADILRRTFLAMAQRHEVLRTQFVEKDGEPYQKVVNLDAWLLPVVDLSSVTGEAQAVALQKTIDEELAVPFDLSHAPLLRTTLVKLCESEHVFIGNMHHIISDGWSIGVFAKEFATIYAALVEGNVDRLTPLRVQYRDYTVWQRGWLKENELNRQVTYWKEHLSGVPILHLPTDRPRPHVQSYSGAYHYFILSESITQSAKQFCQEQNVSLFMGLLSVFQLVIYRFSGQDDFAVGTPIANRTHEDLEALIGFFVNTLALRADLSENPSYSELLSRVRETTLGAYAHQDLPFERLVDEVDAERSLNYSPLFQVSFILQNAPKMDFTFKGVKSEPASTGHDTAKFDITMEFMSDTPELSGRIEYNTDLFDAASIEKLVERFEFALEQVLDHPETRVDDIQVVRDEEETELLALGRGPSYVFENDGGLISAFHSCVDRFGDRIAVTGLKTSYSYSELDRRSNQLALLLQNRGVVKGDRVAIALQRSEEFVVAVFAILKAGASYVPMDASYPEQRIAYILNDSCSKCVITDNDFDKPLDVNNVSAVHLQENEDEIKAQSVDSINVEIDRDSEAYVMYTSGSTGNPKGVRVPHRGVVRLAKNTNYLQLDENTTGLLLAAVGFDASTFEIFTTLLNGGRICVMPPGLASYHNIRDVIQHEGVNLALFPTGLFNGIVAECPEYIQGLKQLVVGGDVLSIPNANKTHKLFPDVSLINAYGPTENATITTAYRIEHVLDERFNAPIGKPISGTDVFILDKNLRPVPRNVGGDIYSSGSGVALGYVNLEEQTQKVFISNPFSQGESDKILYRTGDRGRWLANGNIEFLGRSDQQVKVRGFRIEIGEIEAALMNLDGVKNAVVLVVEGANSINALAAYAVLEPSKTLEVVDIKEALSRSLPNYMVPAFVTLVEDIPLTKNGKVDKKALPRPDFTSETQQYIAPETDLQKQLVSIWQDVLEVDTIGIEDNFFNLGGHSLLATQVVSRIRESLSIELPVKEIFEAPTVSMLSKRFESVSNQTSSLPPIVKKGAGDVVPASYAQRRLWFIEQFDQGKTTYNMPMILKLTGSIDEALVNASILEVVKRHEVLRTQFIEKEGEPYQQIVVIDAWDMPVIDLSADSHLEQEAKVKAHITEELAKAFDLTCAPLMRTSLIKLSPREYVFVGNTHHIVSDGWSMNIFQREFIEIYAAKLEGQASSLAELDLQYSDYTLWQREWMESGHIDNQIAYWKEKLSGVETLEFPTDRPRPPVQTFNGAFYHFDLSSELTSNLENLCRDKQLSLFMGLLSVFQVLMNKYTGQDDFCIGTPIANRNHKGVEELIGFFVNTLGLRANLSGAPTFVEVMDRTKETTLQAYDHQDAPFEHVLDELSLVRNVDRSPLFQVMFILQNIPEITGELPGFSSETIDVDGKVSKFDFTVEFFSGEDALKGRIEYNTDLFDESTMANLAKYYIRLLEQVVVEPEASISSYQLLDENEKREIVVNYGGRITDIDALPCVHQRFEKMAAQFGDNQAVGDLERSLSYTELNEYSNRLARLMIARNVSPGDYVGLAIDRSIETIVGMLAILKCGATYVPIDLNYPASRIQYMIADVQPKLILVNGVDLTQTEGGATNILDLATASENLSTQATHNLDLDFSCHTPAYVLYTSGSTGNPKGVMLPHRGIVRLVCDSGIVEYNHKSRGLQQASLGFDASTLEIYSMLLNGGYLHIAPPGLVSLAQIEEALEKALLNTIVFSTAIFHTAAIECPKMFLKVNHILIGGDVLSPFHVNKVLEACPGIEIVNCYGPTENAVITSANVMSSLQDERKPLSIGRPINGTQIYVLDEGGNVLPEGLPGELCTSGTGLAVGYLNQPEQTQSKFVAHPFIKSEQFKLYKTGDRARWLPNGELEFLGRIDNQVKLRGFRIELGEVEAAIQRCDFIKESVVVIRDDVTGEKTLVAYYVLDEGVDNSGELSGELRRFLSAELPGHMVPQFYVSIEKIPYTVNGKVDRKALPIPKREKSDYQAPVSDTEKKVEQVWKELLKIDKVSKNDNLFEIGASSILMVQAHRRIQEFASSVQVVDLFQYPTIHTLSEYIDKHGEQGKAMVTAAQARAKKRVGSQARRARQKRTSR